MLVGLADACLGSYYRSCEYALLPVSFSRITVNLDLDLRAGRMHLFMTQTEQTPPSRNPHQSLCEPDYVDRMNATGRDVRQEGEVAGPTAVGLGSLVQRCRKLVVICDRRTGQELFENPLIG